MIDEPMSRISRRRLIHRPGRAYGAGDPSPRFAASAHPPPPRRRRLRMTRPRATAAAQLRYLPHRDLRKIYTNPSTSIYLRRCIERLEENSQERKRVE